MYLQLRDTLGSGHLPKTVELREEDGSGPGAGSAGHVPSARPWFRLARCGAPAWPLVLHHNFLMACLSFQ